MQAVLGAADLHRLLSWTQFLRGESGKQQRVAARGITPAYSAPRGSAVWAQFVRNVFAVIPKGSAEVVAVTIRTIFAQPHAGLCPHPARHRRRHARPTVPGGHSDADGGEGGPDRLRGLSPPALEKDSVDEPAGAA